MTRARAAAAFGLALCLVAGAFAATPLYVPGLATLLMLALAAGWVSLAGRGARVDRMIDRHSVPEGGSLRVSVTRGELPTIPDVVVVLNHSVRSNVPFRKNPLAAPTTFAP